MSDQKTPKGLKQSLLDQINSDKKAVEALSDEELEAVAGGVGSYSSEMTVVVPGMNTGAVRPSGPTLTVVVRPGMNTGTVRPSRPTLTVELR